MEQKKDSFILYDEYYELIKELPTEHKGLLLAAIYEYQINGEEIDLPVAARIIFKIIKKRMDFNSEKYQEICDRNKANGMLGGRPKPQRPFEITQNNRPLFIETQNNRTVKNEAKNNPNKPDTDTDTDIDTDSIKKDKDKSLSKESKKFTPPTLQEIEDYIKAKNLFVEPLKFFDYFNEGNWTDSKGQKVHNWKQKLLTWDGKNRTEKTINAARGILKGGVKSETYSQEIPL